MNWVYDNLNLGVVRTQNLEKKYDMLCYYNYVCCRACPDRQIVPQNTESPAGYSDRAFSESEQDRENNPDLIVKVNMATCIAVCYVCKIDKQILVTVYLS